MQAATHRCGRRLMLSGKNSNHGYQRKSKLIKVLCWTKGQPGTLKKFILGWKRFWERVLGRGQYIFATTSRLAAWLAGCRCSAMLCAMCSPCCVLCCEIYGVCVCAVCEVLRGACRQCAWCVCVCVRVRVSAWILAWLDAAYRAAALLRPKVSH